MIFVTAGTTEFDALVREADKLGIRAVAQIGNGKYEPKNMKWFRFKPSLEQYFKKADLVITHSGAGTLLELASRGKRAVVLINPNSVNNPDIVQKLSAEGVILWCKSPKGLGKCISEAKKRKFKKYRRPKCGIAEEIRGFLK